MKIDNTEPVIVEAIPAKTYPNLFIGDLSILCPDLTSGRITMTLKPFNADKGEILNGNDITLNSDKLWQAVQEVPEVAQCFGAILMAVVPLRNWLALQNAEVNIPVEEENLT